MKTIRTALVGYGYWGANLGRNIEAAAGLDLVHVVDGSADRRRLALDRHASVAVHAELGPVLEDRTIDAIALATPAGSHAALARMALDSGRHVFVEKPLATNVVDATDLRDRAAEAALTLMVGHTFLYSSPVRWLKQAIEAGELGAINYVYSQRLNLGRIRSDCNALWNFGPHDVSILRYLLDERPVEVSATGFSFLQKGIDDVCFATLRFPSGAAASLHVSWIDPRKTRLMTVVGDRQMAVYDDVSPDSKIWMYDAGAVPALDATFGEFGSLGDFEWRTRAGDVRLPQIAMKEPLLVEMEAFALACATGIPPLTDAEHGLEVVRVLCAIEESAGLRGCPVGIEW